MLDPKTHDWTVLPGQGLGPLSFDLSREAAAELLGPPDETALPFREPEAPGAGPSLAEARRERAAFEERCRDKGDLVDTWRLKGGRNRLDLLFEGDHLVEIHGGLPWRGLECCGVHVGQANRWRSVAELIAHGRTVVRDWEGSYVFLDLDLMIGAPDGASTETSSFRVSPRERFEAALRRDAADGLLAADDPATVVKGTFAFAP